MLYCKVDTNLPAGDLSEFSSNLRPTSSLPALISLIQPIKEPAPGTNSGLIFTGVYSHKHACTGVKSPSQSTTNPSPPSRNPNREVSQSCNHTRGASSRQPPHAQPTTGGPGIGPLDCSGTQKELLHLTKCPLTESPRASGPGSSTHDLMTLGPGLVTTAREVLAVPTILTIIYGDVKVEDHMM